MKKKQQFREESIIVGMWRYFGLSKINLNSILLSNYMRKKKHWGRKMKFIKYIQ